MVLFLFSSIGPLSRHELMAILCVSKWSKYLVVNLMDISLSDNLTSILVKLVFKVQMPSIRHGEILSRIRRYDCQFCSFILICIYFYLSRNGVSPFSRGAFVQNSV